MQRRGPLGPPFQLGMNHCRKAEGMSRQGPNVSNLATPMRKAGESDNRRHFVNILSTFCAEPTPGWAPSEAQSKAGAGLHRRQTTSQSVSDNKPTPAPAGFAFKYRCPVRYETGGLNHVTTLICQHSVNIRSLTSQKILSIAAAAAWSSPGIT